MRGRAISILAGLSLAAISGVSRSGPRARSTESGDHHAKSRQADDEAIARAEAKRKRKRAKALAALGSKA